jgi:hypothetical protein
MYAIYNDIHEEEGPALKASKYYKKGTGYELGGLHEHAYVKGMC